jgi:Sigma-70 region 2
MKAGEHSDDSSRRRRRAPFVPGEAWIEAFEAQCVDAMVKRLHRFAAAWARILGGEYAANDADYADELVQDVLTDAMEGVLRWDPAKGDLEPYLIDVIRLRARRDRKRAERHEHVPLDASTLEDPSLPIEQLEGSLAADASPEVTDSGENMTAEMTRTMTKLRALVPGDLLAQRFLDAVDNEDATTRAQVMRITGLTSSQYHNTRRRLARLVGQLRSGRNTSTKEVDHETT